MTAKELASTLELYGADFRDLPAALREIEKTLAVARAEGFAAGIEAAAEFTEQNRHLLAIATAIRALKDKAHE